MRTKKKRSFPLSIALARWLKSRGIDWRILVGAVVCYLLAFLIVVVAIQKNTLFAKTPLPELGTVAGEDIIVDRDILYVDEGATAELREASAALVPPVFAMNDEITRQSIESLRRFREMFLQGHGERSEEGGSEAVLPQKMLLQLQREFPRLIGRITTEELSLLLSADNMETILDEASVLLQEVMYSGLLAMPDSRDQEPGLFAAGTVDIWQGGAGKERIEIAEVATPDRLPEWAMGRMESESLDAVDKNLVVLILELFAEENAFYDQEKTELEKKRTRDEVQDVVRKLVEGQVIARRGDIVDEETLRKVRTIGESTITVNLTSIAGTAAFLGLIFALSAFLLNRRFYSEGLTMAEMSLLAGSALLCLLVGAFIVQINWDPAWLPVSVLIPISTFTILITLIINARVGVVFSLILAALVLVITRMNVGAFLFAFFSGVAGCAVTLKSERRIDLIRAGLILAAFDFLVLVMLGFLSNFRMSEMPLALGWGVANGFLSGILSLGFVPILEHILNAATRFRLMELSDLNAPIFKRMLSLAPGTYNHSIMVANLAETACTRIGANALLARVGAYYHDIGKVDQSKYFVENQQAQNRHDDLKPSLSAAVIKSHLKQGIEKAKELGLPKEVIDIISQHHGRGLISYFYQRALDANADEKVSSEDYRYSGEWPRTKEAAVVMLADAVEATSRTLKKPTIPRLEKMIWSIIMDRFNAGGLSRSNLTFNDLDKIKASFVNILAGYFHTRIEYPKQKEPGKQKEAPRQREATS